MKPDWTMCTETLITLCIYLLCWWNLALHSYCVKLGKMLDYYCTRIEVSVLRREGWGGGGSLHKVKKKVPEALKHKHKMTLKLLGGGGEFFFTKYFVRKIFLGFKTQRGGGGFLRFFHYRIFFRKIFLGSSNAKMKEKCSIRLFTYFTCC